MISSRTLISLLASLSVAGPALAQDNGTALDDLDAEWMNDTQIRIEFDYQGGACEKPGPAETGAVVDGALAVTIPTEATSDVCTLQMSRNEVEVAVPADRSVKQVEVTLLAPDGGVIGTGATAVDFD